MNYNRIYNELIQHAKHRGWTRKTAPEYVERHHIIPRSMGGTDCRDNLVFLTYREHFLGHWLLYKISTSANKSKMANAWFKMCQVNRFQSRCTSKHYDKARKAFSDNNPFKDPEVIKLVKSRMTENNPMKNPEIANKVRQAMKGKFTGEKNPFYNQKHSAETLQKVSGENHYSHKAGYTPYVRTDEHKHLISVSNTGRSRPDLGLKNKEKANTWEITTPEGATFIIKNLNNWAVENDVKPHWLYRSSHGYKAIKL
jgi:hypothetical protein